MTYQYEQASSESRNFYRNTVFFRSDLSRRTEHTTCERDTECHERKRHGDSPLLRVGPVHRVFGIIGTIPFDEVRVPLLLWVLRLVLSLGSFFFYVPHDILSTVERLGIGWIAVSALVIEALVFILSEGIFRERQRRLWLHAELRRGAYSVGIKHGFSMWVHLKVQVPPITKPIATPSRRHDSGSLYLHQTALDELPIPTQTLPVEWASGIELTRSLF